MASPLAMLVCILAEQLRITVSRFWKIGRLPHGFCQTRYYKQL
jgi:hypothetical protein